jgi:hypothetical protein
MYVRSLIGQRAGQIIETPYHVAQAMFMNGTAEPVTPEEVEAAKLPPVSQIETRMGEDEIPQGYAIEPDPFKGFNVKDPGGHILTKDILLENMPRAREWAREHHATVLGVRPPQASKPGRPVGGSKQQQAAAIAAASAASPPPPPSEE